MQGPLRCFQQDLHKIFAYGAVLDNARTSWRGSQPGSPQDLLTRTCARSCRIPTRSSHGPAARSHFISRTFCASLRLDIAEEPFYARILGESCRAPGLQQPFCASLRSRNALGHLRRALLCEKLQGKCRAPDCEPARSKCTWTSQKSRFTREFTGKAQRPKI